MEHDLGWNSLEQFQSLNMEHETETSQNPLGFSIYRNLVSEHAFIL